MSVYRTQSAHELCAAYVDAMCVTFKHDLDREAIAHDVMRTVHEIFDRQARTTVFVEREAVTGPEAAFCGDCMGPVSSSCDYFGHGTMALGELMEAYG